MDQKKPTVWAERFPHPGPAPAVPPDRDITSDTADEWFRERFEWNEYVVKLRRHEIARSLDWLNKADTLSMEQRIARNVAASILDGTFSALAAIRAS